MLVVAVAAAGQIKFPKPVGYVNDFANVIDEASKQKIEALALEVKQKTGAEIVVVTMPTIGDEDYKDYANRLFEAWGIGEKGKDNGVLIFNAVGERRVWIEVGYGLEAIIPDAYAHRVYRDILAPNLRAGLYGRGFYEAVRALAGRIAEAAGVEITGAVLLAPSRAPEGEGGGQPLSAVWLLLLFLLPFLLLGRGRRRRSGFWYWGGPWYGGGWGGGGGFGGGFGGFGGGASGGGGAGGGY